MIKTIWIGADYPYYGQGYTIFTDRAQFGYNTRCTDMITADNIPPGAECIYTDGNTSIYRYAGHIFQVEADTKEIIVVCDD